VRVIVARLNQLAVGPQQSTRPDFGLLMLRVALGFLWMSGAGWKTPPDFGRESGTGLYRWAGYAVEYPVFAPYSSFVEGVILPNIVLFGWLTLVTEAALGAFLLVGLWTRLFALVGIVQIFAIIGSAFNAPHEWPWSFYLMLVGHVVLFTTSAGRHYGADGLLSENLGVRLRSVGVGFAVMMLVATAVFSVTEDGQVIRWAATPLPVATVLVVTALLGLTGVLTNTLTVIRVGATIAAGASLLQLAQLGRDSNLLQGSASSFSFLLAAALGWGVLALAGQTARSQALRPDSA
jgi:thiosulfate dehydrogenase (quinone) large subunit